MVDTGSSVDILFKDALDKFNLEFVILNSCTSPLYGFTGDSVIPIGTIILSVTLGQPPTQIKWLIKFLAVDTLSAYNIILERYFLVRTKRLLSIYHYVLKFHVGDRVGVIHGDQHIVRKCYAASTNPTALLKHCVQVTTKDDVPMHKEVIEIEIDEEHSEVQKEEDYEKRVPIRQEHGTPVGNLESVSIKDDDLSKVVRICANFWRRADVAKSSPNTSDSSFKHFRCTMAFCTVGHRPHWTSSHV
ncbi:hypothetical protein ACOSQ2_027568 [Xanthoceras sorbifolium]